MMKRFVMTAILVLGAGQALAADPVTVPAAEVEAIVGAMFKSAPEDWKPRVTLDETQRICTETRNNPKAADGEKLIARELATVVYPEDGNVMGDWKKGQEVAQKGTGGQFSDKPDTYRGGNCYACHQMAKSELSYGTLGPSLQGYGKLKNFDAAANKAAYAKIYNAQGVFACSNMPRFGYHKFLSIEQIKDVTAYLMSPESPVNK
ncbi:MAG: sulfur oxidation c-type cytochrome SoxX [Hyphomicrobiaceae bacterium]